MSEGKGRKKKGKAGGAYQRRTFWSFHCFVRYGENESINALEICAGQGRNISTILKRLRPYKYVAVDQD